MLHARGGGGGATPIIFMAGMCGQDVDRPPIRIEAKHEKHTYSYKFT